MGVPPTWLAFSLFLFVVTTGPVLSGSSSPQCKKNQGIEYHLRQAGINLSDVTRYTNILKRNNIDEALLPSLTIPQLQNLGIDVFGDRLKIQKYFSQDGDDCGSNKCSRGRCIDGFNCHYCRCDATGYYGPTCQLKCPCQNGATCRDKQTGFECVCSPGYSGDLCQHQWLDEDRFTKLESQVKQLVSHLKKAQRKIAEQDVTLRAVKAKLNTTWSIVRVDEVLNKLLKISLHQVTPTYHQKLPMCLSNTTKAIIVSVYFFYQGPAKKHGYLNFDIYQKDNEKLSKAKLKNTHYDVHYNTWYYEVMLPWNMALDQELVFKVTQSHTTAVGSNWYQIKLVGYIMA